MVEAVAVAFSMAWPQEVVQDGQGGEQAHGVLAAFRGKLFRCLGKYRTLSLGSARLKARSSSRGTSPG
jgi:hypothetical protein